MQNIGVIDNLEPKLLRFFDDVLLHSRLMDSHQVKDERVAHTVAA